MDELPAASRDNSYEDGLGLLLVFSHENFLRENLRRRDGTLVDAERLKCVFAAFNFEVQVYHEQTRQQIADVLCSVQYEKYKSLVVVVMSHGQTGGLIAAKDDYYNVQELYETLLYKPELRGKPKAIILQACRGSEFEKRGLRGNLGLVSDVQSSNIVQDIKESDCLFAYSTVEGQQSFRDLHGSWYIQALCDVMERGPEHQCMTSILTNVQRQVLQTKSKDYTAQTPTFVSYLKRNFILHRKKHIDYSSISENLAEEEISLETHETEEKINMKTPNKNDDKNRLDFDSTYPCVEDYRGPVVIFYDADADINVQGISNDFSKMNFNVQCENYEPTVEDLKSMANNWQLAYSSSLIVVFMFPITRHADLQKIALTAFGASNSCENLHGKPKILIFTHIDLPENVQEKRGTLCEDSIPEDLTFATKHSDFVIVHGHSQAFLKQLTQNMQQEDVMTALTHAMFTEVTSPLSHFESTLRCSLDFRTTKKLLRFKMAIRNWEYGIWSTVDNYFDRQCLTEDLKDKLEKSSRTHSFDVLITGLPGIGKTQLVLNFIHQNRNDYKNVIVVNSKHLESEFRELAKILTLKTSEAINKTPIEHIINDVYGILSCKKDKCLFVFDNIEAAQDVKYDKYFPQRRNSAVCMLAVSSISGESEHFRATFEFHIKVDTLSSEESFIFLNNLLPNYNATDLKQLARELSHFPFALQLACTHIKKSKCTVKNFLEYYREKSNEFFDSTDSEKFYNNTIFTLVDLILNQMKDQSVLNLTYIITLCESEKIPCNFVKVEASNHDMENVKPKTLSFYKNEIQSALIYLMKLSLIRFNGSFCEMHRLVQRAIFDKLKKENQLTMALKLAIEKVIMFHGFAEMTDFTLKKDYVPHAIKIWNSALENGVFDEKTMFYILERSTTQIVKDMLDTGLFTEVLTFVNRMNLQSLSILGEEDDIYLASLSQEGSVHEKLANYACAIQMYDNVLSIRNNKFEVNRIESLILMSNKAYALERMGNFEESLKIYDILLSEILELKRLQLEGTEFHIMVLCNTAGVLESIGHYNRALEIYQRALQLLENYDQNGFDRNSTAAEKIERKGRILQIKHNEINVLIKMGEYEIALKLCDTLLEKLKVIFDKENPQIYQCKLLKAIILFEIGNYEDSCKTLDALVKVQSLSWGKNNPITLSTMLNKGRILSKEGHFDEALTIFTEILNAETERYGDSHPMTMNTLERIGQIYKDCGHYLEALNIFNQVIAVNTEWLGEVHQETLLSMNNKADLLHSIGEYATALQLHETLLTKRIETLGENHPHTLNSMNNKAMTLQSLGRLQEALVTYDLLLPLAAQLRGDKHPNTLIYRSNRAELLRDMGKLNEAKEEFRIILQMNFEDYKCMTKELAATINNAAGVLDQLGEVDKAIELYTVLLENLPSMDENLGLKPLRATTLHNRGASWYVKREYDRALEDFQIAFAVRKQVLGDNHPHTVSTKEFVVACISAL